MIQKGGETHEYGGQAHEAVQHGNKLGHGGHFDPGRENGTNDSPDNHHRNDNAVVANRGIEQGGSNGKKHAHNAIDIAAACLLLIT